VEEEEEKVAKVWMGCGGRQGGKKKKEEMNRFLV
jgi:hypothetical protein